MGNIILRIVACLAAVWALAVVVAAFWRMLVYPFSLGLVEAIQGVSK